MVTSGSTKYFLPEVLSKIARLEVRAKHVVEGIIGGMHASPYRGVSVEFASRRPYVPGDDIRRLDWRVYAKADRFFVKEYEEETNLRTHIMLDCSGSMAYPEHPGTGRMTKWDYAATLSASLAHLLVYQGDAVGLTLFDHDIRLQIPPSTSRMHLSEMGGALEAETPREKTNVKLLFQQLAVSLPHRGMVVIVSDLLTDPEDVLRGLQRFRFRRHDVIVLHVLDHDELHFEFPERTLFENMEETRTEVLTDPQALRHSYLKALNDFTDCVRRACLDQNIDYALISTADRLDVALTTYLTSRMHRLRARA